MIWRMPCTTYVMGMYGLITWKKSGVVWMGNVPAQAVSCSISRMMATNLPGNPNAAMSICMMAANTRAVR